MNTGLNIFLWVIQILLAALFILMGGQKLMAVPEVVANFERWGMPPYIHLVIGFFEVLGAIGLLVPRAAGMAAVGLIIIMIGAVGTHLAHAEYGMAPVPLVVLILLGAIAYYRGPMAIFGGTTASEA